MAVSEIMTIQAERSSGAILEWQQCVTQHMLPGLNVASEGGNIRAELRAFDFAGARLWFLGSNAQKVVRSQAAGSRAIPVAIFQLEGSCYLAQGGRECELMPGCFAFLDAARPLKLEHSADFRELYMQFPRNAFRQCDFQRAVAIRMSKSSPNDRSLFNCVNDVWEAAPTLRSDEHGAAVNAVISLSSITSAFRQARDVVDVPIRVERAMTYIETHLGDHAMSAETVAAAQQVSRRYLDELFAASGHRIDSWIWERRLQRAAEELKLSQEPQRSLLSIALDLGFKDPSHFSRMFTRRHGVSPREYRRAHQSGVRAEPVPLAARRSH